VARAVLTARAAACVNIVPGAESHYWWQGRLERAPEFVLMIKTTRAKCREVIRRVRAAHSYEVPEIIFVPIAAGERNYMKWLTTAVAVLVLAVTARADRVDELISSLGSTDEVVRAEAADELTQRGGPRVVEKFRAMLASNSAEQRQMAVAGLLQVSATDADVDLVRERLKDEDSSVRWTAVLALAGTGRTEVIPWLRELAQNDPAESVREAAAEAAARLSKVLDKAVSVREARRQAERDAADVPANWRAAETYLDESREDLAERHLKNVLAYDMENRHGYTDRALFALGFSYGRRNQHAKAVYCLDELLKRWPEFKDKDKALYCLGLSRLALGQREAGRAVLRQLVREFPDSAVARAAQPVLAKLEAK